MVQDLIFKIALHVTNASVGVNCDDGSTKVTCDTGLSPVGAGTPQVQQLLAIAFGVIAAVTVLMIVIAGFRLTIAQGSPQETTKARNTIVYALIGLVISLSAEAIVAFVLGKS